MEVVIYTKPSCPYCVKAKDLLSALGYSYKELVVGSTVTKADIQQQVNASGAVGYVVSTVPQIFIDGRHVGGYDDLKAALDI